MRHRAVTAGVLGVALLVVGYWIGSRGAVQEQRGDAEASHGAILQTPRVAGEIAPVADSSASSGERASVDLRDMSQTFRNSTLLVAIRGAGFYCDDVVSADETADGVWVASCANRLGYTLSVVENQFNVCPVAHYFDSVGPPPTIRSDQCRLSHDSPVESVDQQGSRQ